MSSLPSPNSFDAIKTPKKSYFANEQMRNALGDITKKMTDDKWMPDIIMGINRGGCIPGVYLSHQLKKPHEVIDIRLRDHKAKPNLSALEKAYAFQKKILIIDDINDTGETFKYIENNFGKGNGRIKFAALINNKPSSATVDYFGYEIDKEQNPVWIVFPWEIIFPSQV
jgi:hypoxanthine phosphoribosyltransferase